MLCFVIPSHTTDIVRRLISSANPTKHQENTQGLYNNLNIILFCLLKILTIIVNFILFNLGNFTP